MILSGKEIERQYELGYIDIQPFDSKKINPNSYNLTLNNEFAVYKSQVPMAYNLYHKECPLQNPIDIPEYLDMKTNNEIYKFEIPESGFILYPGILYLARTNERTHTNWYAPKIDGRSSIGRLGITVHVTAGFGDCGFDGFWTLEIFTILPVKIYPNVDICQIVFEKIEGEKTLYHNAKYNHNTGVQASMMYKDFEDKK